MFNALGKLHNQIFIIGLIIQLISAYMSKKTIPITNRELNEVNAGAIIFDESHIFERSGTVRGYLIRHYFATVAWVYLVLGIIIQMIQIEIPESINSNISSHFFVFFIILIGVAFNFAEIWTAYFFYLRAVIKFAKKEIIVMKRNSNFDLVLTKQHLIEDLGVLFENIIGKKRIEKLAEKLLK